ncbi:MAG: CTP synthase, partial [Acidimicrobiales bacterium]|nr:CTP synthase [Acidimicrobiales bacterium]
DLSGWEKVVSQVSASERPVRIGVVGKYVNLPDAYLSVGEALRHAGFHHGAKVEVDWIQAEKVPDLLDTDRMLQLDGMVIPGGFGERGIEGKIDAVEFARLREIPCLGLCLGLQVMVIEVARHLAGLEGANSREFDTITPHPVIDLMDDQHNVVDMGGTMRLGSYVAQLEPGSKVADAYGTTVVSERHRHRYEVNPRYRAKLEDVGLRCSGTSADGVLVEFVELPVHPYWVGTQAHPEFKSRPDRPHPLFRELLAAALRRADGRLPRLISIDTDVGAAS